MILITFFIYIRAGREIYKKHKQLKEFSLSTSHHDPEPIHHIEDLFSSTKTTEVMVTTEVIDKAGAIDLAPLGADERRRSQGNLPQKPAKAAYSVTISSSPHRESPGDNATNNLDSQLRPTTTADSQAGAAGLHRTATNTHTTISAGAGNKTGGTNTTTSNQNPLRRRAAYEANNATWSYTKCALLFFTAMLVTWIPSSANRVFSVIHSGQASLALEYMSAFVLPLQGFWNAIIYTVTSWGACKMLWEDVQGWLGCCFGNRRRMGRGRGLPDPHELMPGGNGGVGGKGGVGLHLHRSTFQMMGSGRNGPDPKADETESMTELAASRPGSSDSPTEGAATPVRTAERRV